MPWLELCGCGAFSPRGTLTHVEDVRCCGTQRHCVALSRAHIYIVFMRACSLAPREKQVGLFFSGSSSPWPLSVRAGLALHVDNLSLISTFAHPCQSLCGSNPVWQHLCRHDLVATFLRLHPYHARVGKLIKHTVHRSNCIPLILHLTA